MEGAGNHVNIFPIIAVIIGAVLIIGMGAAGMFFFLFLKKRQKPIVNNFPEMRKNETQSDVPLKICPQCNRSYSDHDLSFCLEDGQLLSGSFNISPGDGGETISSSKFSSRL